jgi:hypothetical protein
MNMFGLHIVHQLSQKHVNHIYLTFLALIIKPFPPIRIFQELDLSNR